MAKTFFAISWQMAKSWLMANSLFPVVHLIKILNEYQIHMTTNSRFSHVLRNKCNYSQSINMFIIRGVLICI